MGRKFKDIEVKVKNRLRMNVRWRKWGQKVSLGYWRGGWWWMSEESSGTKVDGHSLQVEKKWKVKK